ncbi:MAG TPA: hypothetical protein VFS08_13270, partial [Gemmatimonadaceae bacterium]|nr:hypothetical protein [Gemmatimonadaceae bacterium]
MTAPHPSPIRARLVSLALLAALGCTAGAGGGADTAAGGAAATPPAPEPEAAQLSPVGGYKGRFNNDNQSHADFCVRLRAPSVALRYADGRPSGFALSEAILQPVAGNGVSCPEPGLARLDAREIVLDTEGRPMLFHRGGWGFVGNDPASAVHFGHVLAAELDTVGLRFVRADTGNYWTPAPTTPWSGEGQQAGNGTACAALAEPQHVAVHSIPGDMRYLNSARTNAIAYAIYGSPAEDLGTPADRARGVKYTMLTWSWINTRGGGVARALVADGDEFRRCTDVPPITLASVADADTQRITGWVRAVYGAIRAGDGQPLHGWLVA